MTTFWDKQVERLSYLWLRISLGVGWVAVKSLIILAPLIRRRHSTKDFLFFPYLHVDNIGTLARVQEYVPLLTRDCYTFDVHYTSSREEYLRMFSATRRSKTSAYIHFHKVFWQRLGWAVRSSNYRAVFVQRAMLPNYYDQRYALLEQLLHAYNNNITVDYYDADYARNEIFYKNILRYCNKVAVVNDFLYDYYSQRFPKVLMNDLSVNAERYEIKTEYALHQPIRIFWTGSLFNAKENLVSIIPLLTELNQKYPLVLIMVSPSRQGYDQNFIEHHLWDERTFFNLLATSDIALYPVSRDNDFSRGKVAYKSLEYAASKVPMVASPQGLSSRFVAEEDVLMAHNSEEWKQQLIRLIEDEALRIRLAESAYQKFMTYHEINATYKRLIEILEA